MSGWVNVHEPVFPGKAVWHCCSMEPPARTGNVPSTVKSSRTIT